MAFSDEYFYWHNHLAFKMLTLSEISPISNYNVETVINAKYKVKNHKPNTLEVKCKKMLIYAANSCCLVISSNVSLIIKGQHTRYFNLEKGVHVLCFCDYAHVNVNVWHDIHVQNGCLSVFDPTNSICRVLVTGKSTVHSLESYSKATLLWSGICNPGVIPQIELNHPNIVKNRHLLDELTLSRSQERLLRSNLNGKQKHECYWLCKGKGHLFDTLTKTSIVDCFCEYCVVLDKTLWVEKTTLNPVVKRKPRKKYKKLFSVTVI